MTSMVGLDGDVRFLPPRTATRSAAHAAAAERMTVSLHELCMELGAGSVDGEALGQQRVGLNAVRVDAGGVAPAIVADADGGLEVAIVLSGLVLADTDLAGRTATQIFGPGDLLPLAEDGAGSLSRDVSLRVAQTATLVPLDGRFSAISRRWPEVGTLVMRCAARQLARSATHQAISQLSRIELRLLAMMWHLAERWGRVTSEGLVLELDLTHTMLGQLVGAKRPTVSLALKVLAEEGMLVRRDRHWLLARDSARLLTDEATLARTA